MTTHDTISNVVLGHLSKIAKIGPAHRQKMRPSIRIHKRRSAMDRLKARQRYQKNKYKLKIWRRRYNQKTKHLRSARKMMQRTKPAWFGKKRSGTYKPSKPKGLRHLFHHTFSKPRKTSPFKIHHAKPKKFKIYTPKFKHPH